RKCQLHFNFRSRWNPYRRDFAGLQFILQRYLQPTDDLGAVGGLNFRLFEKIQTRKAFMYIAFQFIDERGRLGHRVSIITRAILSGWRYPEEIFSVGS